MKPFLLLTIIFKHEIFLSSLNMQGQSLLTFEYLTIFTN